MARHYLEFNMRPPVLPSDPWTRTVQLGLGGFLLAAGWLSISAGMQYPGHPMVFASFAVLANALLLNGFHRGAIYFDTFIGIFFWLGFFLKLTVRLAFFDGRFGEATGAFDRTGAAYDRALIVISVAFVALLLASLLRQRFFRYPDTAPGCREQPLYRFYCDHRSALLLIFAIVVALVAASNLWLVIYQRGMASQTVLPFGLNGVYKWLLQFGLASVSALVIRFEIERAGQLTGTAIIAPLLESCISNVSMMSRGMVLNASALVVGSLRLLSALRIRVRAIHYLFAAVGFGVLFAGSVLAVNYLRTKPMYDTVGGVEYIMGEKEVTSDTPRRVRIFRAEAAAQMTHPLFIDRWVGLEGVMAVSAAPGLGWDLWRQAWGERFDEQELSLYDQRFIDSPYREHGNKGAAHYVSLPGLVAFLFYPGSLGFLFVAMMGFAVGAASLEYLCYRYCGQNWVLCSLFAQVIAFRFASFGYVPAQSYLLFGSIVLNGLLFWGASRLLAMHYARAPAVGP